MKNVDKTLWTVWWIVTLFVSLSTATFFIAKHTTKVELTLIKGEKVNIQLFRFTPHNISMQMRFSNRNGIERPELGNYAMKVGWEETGILDFPNPGEPVKLLLGDTQQKFVYEAMPASGYGANTVGRSLILYQDDNNSHQFPWGVYKEQRFTLDSGFNELQITVLEVGKSLTGENILLYINPPLGFKINSYGLLYEFLWFFHIWPIYFLILFIWYLMLILRKKRRKSAQQ